MKLNAVMTVFFVFAAFPLSSLSARQVSDRINPEAPDVAELTERLRSLQNSVNGLSYLQTNIPENDKRVRLERRISVSWDGNVALDDSIPEQRQKPAAGEKTRSLALTSIVENFRFVCGHPADSDPPYTTQAMAVQFLEPNFYSHARSVIALADGNLSILTYISESSTNVSREVFRDEEYWALECDHPKRSNRTYYFDDALQLEYVKWSFSKGDLFNGGEKFQPPRLATEDMKDDYIWGPISYIEIFGRVVPERYRTESIISGKPHRVDAVFSDFKELDTDLTSLIEFKDVVIPEGNGDHYTKVTSQGEPTMRYEVHEGKLVKILDEQMLKAAKAAELREGSSWVNARYILLGLTALVAAGVLIWKRSA